MSKELRLTARVIVTVGVVAALFVIAVGIMTTNDENAEAMILYFGIAGVVLFSAFLIHDLLKGFAELLERSANQETYLKTICEELQRKEAVPHQTARPAAPAAAAKVKAATTDGTGTAEPLLVAESEARHVEQQKEICSACGEIQRAGRNVCWKCGARFYRPEQ